METGGEGDRDRWGRRQRQLGRVTEAGGKGDGDRWGG